VRKEAAEQKSEKGGSGAKKARTEAAARTEQKVRKDAAVQQTREEAAEQKVRKEAAEQKVRREAEEQVRKQRSK
jgi:hypothetical protein